MKIIPDLKLALPTKLALSLFVLALVASGCRGGAPSPAAETPTAAATTAAQEATAPPDADPVPTTAPGDAPVVEDPAPAERPTTQPVTALAEEYPAFDGLYWTAEVGVEPAGDQALRLVSGMPCADLMALLSAGEWRLAQRAVPAPEQTGLVAMLGLLEKGDQAALVTLKELVVAPLLVTGQPTPTPAPADETPPFGCAGTLQVLARQPVAAQGAELAEGMALQYPLGSGCLYSGEQASVGLFYEGPGDLRATVEFTVPLAEGEYSVDDVDLSLTLGRSERRLVETFAEAYAASAASGAFQDIEEGEEYYPLSNNAGSVIVRSTNPLAGEIVLRDYIGDGGAQSFQAGFACPPQE